MKQTTLTVRMDEDLKRRFDAFCTEVGMNASVAVNIFAKRVVRDQKIPFELSTDPFYSETNMAFLRESMDQLSRGEVVVKTLAELEAMEDG